MAADLPERLDRMDQRFDVIDQRFEAVDRRFDVMDQRFDAIDQRFGELRDDLRTEIIASGAETRRYFNVVAESMLSKIQLVAEGVLTVDRKIDRVAAELGGGIARLNRRMLALSARLPPKRRR